MVEVGRRRLCGGSQWGQGGRWCRQGCWFRFRRFDNRFDRWFGKLGWFDYFHFVVRKYKIRELFRYGQLGGQSQRLNGFGGADSRDFGRRFDLDWRRVAFLQRR